MALCILRPITFTIVQLATLMPSLTGQGLIPIKMLTHTSQLSETTRDLFGHKTRGKILAASLACFNRDGFHRVSTAQLAEAADVLEGTLWYHFKAKTDLILAHLEAFEARLDAHLAADIAESPDAIIADFLDIFVILWEFRYLLRDPLSGLNDDDTISLRLKETYQLVEERVEARLHKSAQAGFIDLKDVDAKTLALSCVLIGRYWFDYARVRYAGDPDHNRLRSQCLQQLLSVVRPYFTVKTDQLVADCKAL